MANFEKYAPTLMKWEARMPKHPEGLSNAELFEYAKKDGWVNDPHDLGGATQVGVTIGTYRTYFGKNKTIIDLKNISYGEWRFIMRKYWDRCQGDSIVNQSVAEIFVDWHVNAGKKAILKMQSAFGLSKVDGIVGKQTLGALNGDPEVVFNRIKSARCSYYRKIVANNASQGRFLNGWLRRTESFQFKPE